MSGRTKIEYFWCDMCGDKRGIDDLVEEVYGPRTIELCAACHRASLPFGEEGKGFDVKRLRRLIIQALIQSNNEYEEIAMPKVQKTLLMALCKEGYV